MVYSYFQQLKWNKARLEEPMFRESLEKELLQSPRDSYLYAKIYLKKRWPKAEPTILKCPFASIGYACEVLKKRWPEAEELISSHPGTAVGYSKNILKKRWPKAEEKILTDLDRAIAYTRKVIRGPWYALELEFLRKLNLVRYGDNLTLNSFKNHITRYIKYSSPYQDHPKKDTGYELNTFIKTLKDFCKDKPALILFYMQLSGDIEYKEAEKVIIERLDLVEPYLSYYKKAPWPEAEKTISKSARLSYNYATNVLKSRFPEGEPEITKDLSLQERYLHFLQAL